MESETLKNETLEVERIIKAPVREHVELLNKHFGRYDLAAEALAVSCKDYVIDASCGYGYGSYILSLRAKKVSGLDINRSYLKKAKRLFRASNLDFYTYATFNKMIEERKISKADKIVCVETFEHISKNEAGSFIATILAYLKNDGDLFLTAPLGNDKPCSYNRFHLNKPSLAYLSRSFKPFFRKTNFQVIYSRDSFGRKSKFCNAILKSFRGDI